MHSLCWLVSDERRNRRHDDEPPVARRSSGSGWNPKRREIVGEALEAFGPSARVSVARFGRLEARLVERELGLAPLIGEPHHHDGLVPALAVLILPGVGEDEQFVLDELAIDAAEPMLGAVGSAHHASPGAARTQLALGIGNREAARRAPIVEMLLARPRPKYEAPRRIEDARDIERPIAALGRDAWLCSCGHPSSPSPAVRAGSRPSDRSSAPRSGGNVPASRPPP